MRVRIVNVVSIIMFIMLATTVGVVAYFVLQPCNAHTDKNGDGYCERCGEHFKIVAVYYSEYGAIGDGVTNDFYAIKKAHEAANELNVPVYAEEGKTYLMSTTADNNGNSYTIPIKTNTDWRGCKFIFDSTNVCYEAGSNKECEVNMFTVFYNTTIYNSESDVVKQLNKTISC